MEDDWMRPKMSTKWTAPVRDKPEFLIQRERTIVCSFVGGGDPPTEWREWDSFENREERDAELKRLRKETNWHLRAARYDPILRRNFVEDDETDLLLRLAKLNGLSAW